MGDLLVVSFADKHKADQVLLDLLELEIEHLADLEDAVVVTKNARGKIRIKPYYDLVAAGKGLHSTFWGSLLMTIEEKNDSHDLTAMGVSQQFCHDLKEMMKPNTSAIFVWLKQASPEQIMAEVEKYKGTILCTTIKPNKIK